MTFIIVPQVANEVFWKKQSNFNIAQRVEMKVDRIKTLKGVDETDGRVHVRFLS